MWTPDVVRDMSVSWWESGGEYDTFWKGIKTLKNPLDLWLYQEIIHDTQVDVVVETGTYHGGSAHYFADLGVEVHTVDIAPSKPPLPHPRVTFHRGRSTSPQVLYKITQACIGKRVMVVLDSDHSKANVLAELAAYAPFVSDGSYLIVEDTHLGRWTRHGAFPDGGPGAAIDEWLPDHPEFQVDLERERFGITMHHGGFLKRL